MTLPATDTFTNAGATANLATYNSSWTVVAGGAAFFRVDGATDVVYPDINGTDAMAVWNADSFNADQYSQGAGKATDTVDPPWIGVAVRCATGAFTGYTLQIFRDGSGTVEYSLDRVNAGVFANLAGAGSLAWSSGDILRLEATGAGATVSLKMYKNGVQFGSTVSDSSASRITSGSAGIAGFSNTASLATSLDNWEGGNISAGGSTTTKTMTDTLVASDFALDVTTRIRQMTDTTVVTDGTVMWRRLVRIAEDLLTVVDSVVKSVTGPGAVIYNKVMTDTLSAIDSFFDWLQRRREQIDSITISEGDVFRTQIVTANESIDVTDAFTEWRRLKRVMQDNLDIIDAFSKIVAGAGIVYAKVMSDTTTIIDDAGNRWKMRTSRLSDALNLSDAALDVVTRIRQMNEVVEVSDGVVRIGRFVRVAQDNLEIPDYIVRLLVLDQLYTVDIRFGHTDPIRFGGS